MWDMRCAKNGCCALSKGTQSDGLISDTSTEGFTSGSSSEKLEEGKICEKVVAKETKEVQNELESSIHSKPSGSLHQMRTQCQLYIRWGVSLSFGILLWVALWITDIFKSNPFLKEGWLADVATAKKVTLKAEMLKKPALSTGWFFNLWSYMYSSIISVTTLEILTFLCCVIILVYLETHTRNKWGRTIEQLYYDLFYKSSLNTGAEQSKPEDGNFHSDISEELETKKPEIKKCDGDLSKFNHGDLRNLLMQNETVVISRSGGKRTCYSNKEETSLTKNRVSKSTRGSQNMSNSRKRSLPLNRGKNFARKGNNQSRDLIANELTLIANEPKFGTHRVSSMSKNDETKSIAEHANLTCSVFNNSTSFMSEEIETWFELPNSVQVERVMHSFDTELDEYFETRNTSMPLFFKESTQKLQQFNDCRIGYDCGEEPKAVVAKVEYNGGIISSSPAFRRFLMNLAKDRLAEPYL